MGDTGRMTDESTEIKPKAVRLLPSRVELPSGGWVAFCDEMELSGRDVRRIREGMNAEGAGSRANDLLARTLIAVVREWSLPYQEGLGVPSMLKTPQTALDLLRWDDLRVMEDAVDGFIAKLTGDFNKADDGAPGSPPRPASD